MIEVAIIGAGPAGLAAAMQLARFGLQPLVFEKGTVGGLLRNANWVENYPGFPRGITGPALVRRIAHQASRLGVEIHFDAIQRLDYAAGNFSLETASNTYFAPIVVVASGTNARQMPDFAIPDELKSRCFYEVWPLLNSRAQRIAIIGAGDAAFDYALNLAKANDVILLNRDGQTHCLPLLRQRAADCPRITYHDHLAVQELLPHANTGLTLRWIQGSSSGALTVDYLIAAIGRDPALNFITNRVLQQSAELQRQGVLYYIGDVHNGIYRQTAIAAGEGVLAAMKIYHALQEKSR